MGEEEVTHQPEGAPPSDERIREMARALNEPKMGLLQRLAAKIGMEQMELLFTRTLEIEAAGGMPTSDGQRRRTPGGVLFQLTKELMPARERRKTFREKKVKDGSAPAAKRKTPKLSPDAPQPPTAEQAVALMRAAASLPANQKGPATMKTTIIGRPKQIKKMDTCIAVVMGVKPPPALPKGLPNFPDTTNASVVVFIAAKQWTKAEAALKSDPNDELIIEGFPVNDPQRNITGIWAQSCTTKMIQRSLREKRDDAETPAS